MKFVAYTKNLPVYCRNLAVVSGGDLVVTGTGSPDFGCEFRDADCGATLAPQSWGTITSPYLLNYTLCQKLYKHV